MMSIRWRRRGARLRITNVISVAAVWFAVGAWPHAQDLAVLRLLERADQLQGRGDEVATLRVFEDVVRQFPRDERAPVALLRLAEGRWGLGDADGALLAVGQLREEYGNSPSAAGTYLLEARLRLAEAEGPEDLRDVRATLSRVPALFDRNAYPDSTWRHASAMRRGRIALSLGDLDLAAAEFLAIVEDETRSETTTDAQVELANVFALQEQWTSAAEILQRVVERAPLGDGEAPARERARRRLSLLHRSVFRPLVGQNPWTAVRRVQAPGRGFRDPIGVAVADDGRLVVADEGLDLALAFDPAGALVATTASDDLRLPWWAPDGEAYVLGRRTVQQPFGESRSVVFDIPDDDELDRLEDLRAGARAPFGHWIMLDTDRRQVVRFDRHGGYLETLIDRRSDMEIVDVEVDVRGRIWMLDREDKRVLRVASDGTAEGPVVSGQWRRPEALTVDALGNVYVLDRDRKTVDVFGPDGISKGTVGPRLPDGTELRSPRDIGVDGAGLLYVVDRDADTVFILE